MNDKAREKCIKGPIKLQFVLETNELENYKRKYRDIKSKQRNREDRHQTVHQTGNKSLTPNRHGRKRTNDTDKRKELIRSCHSCG